MKRFALAVLLVLLAFSHAQAGFWDFLFTKKQDNATAEPPKPLFGGKMMNGSEMLSELRTLKAGMSSPTPLTALRQLMVEEPAPAVQPPPAKGKAKAKPKSKAALAAEAKAKEAEAKAKEAQEQAKKAQEQAAAQQNATNSPLGGLLGSSGKTSSLGMVTDLLGKANDLLTNRLSSNMSYQAMEYLFGMLVDQPDLLKQVYVEVPDLSNATPELRKRTLNMAAFLVALKASGLIVDASQKDFEAAKQSYAKIMDIRQKAAQALADAYFKRNQAASLQAADAAQGTTSLRPQDEAFLQQLGAAKAEDFVKDPRVQSLAINLLRESDPATYGRYTMEFAEMKSHYGGYVRGMTGAASMVGFSVIFAAQATTIINKQGAAGGLSMLPLLQQALPECLALAPRLVKMYSSGDESVSGSFSVVRGGKVEKSGLSAQKALDTLGDAGRKALREEIVDNGPKGLLANLHLVAPASAAALADKLVRGETKEKLAQHFASDRKLYSFVDAQAGKCGSPLAYKSITQGLFFRRLPEPDAACKGDTDDQALRLAQRDLREGVLSLENSDMRKIMYATNPNPEDVAAPITLADAQLRIDNLGIDGLIDQQTIMTDRIKMHATEVSYANEAKGKKALKKGHK